MEREVEFLQYIVENIVSNPDDIKIDRKEDELGILLTLRVNKEDMGVVIGKNGNIVSSIRTLLKVVGSKSDQRVNLKIED